MFSNLDGKINKFSIDALNLQKSSLGTYLTQVKPKFAEAPIRKPETIAPKVKLTNPGLLLESMETSVLKLRLNPLDTSKIRWYLEGSRSLGRESLSFSVFNVPNSKKYRRLPILGVKDSLGASRIREVSSASMGASRISVFFSDIYRSIPKVSQNQYSGFNPELFAGLKEESSSETAYSDKSTAYQLRFIGDARFPLNVEFDRLSRSGFRDRQTILAVPSFARRNLSYNLCIYKPADLP